MQITFDAENPAALANFWAQAVGYVIQPPPTGYETWPAYLASVGVPEELWDSASAAVDPAGIQPRMLFQRVPEGKTAKNRVHIDLQSAGGPTVAEDVQRQRVAAEVERLTGLGATYVLTMYEMGVVWAVMLDPEGNEFCA